MGSTKSNIAFGRQAFNKRSEIALPRRLAKQGGDESDQKIN